MSYIQRLHIRGKRYVNRELAFVLQERVYVEPVMPNSEFFGWHHYKANLIQAFIGNLRKFGLWVALYNLVWMWRHRWQRT